MQAFESSHGRVSPMWLIGLYFLQMVGELCLSPVGLSMVTKLSPPRIVGLMMGVWFLANWAANLVGGYVAGTVERVEKGDAFRLFGGQADFWLMFVVSSCGAGIILLAIYGFSARPWLHYLYGSVFPITVLVVAHVVARGLERDQWVPFAWAAFFCFGLTLRALFTGLGIG